MAPESADAIVLAFPLDHDVFLCDSWYNPTILLDSLTTSMFGSHGFPVARQLTRIGGVPCIWCQHSRALSALLRCGFVAPPGRQSCRASVLEANSSPACSPPRRQLRLGEIVPFASQTRPATGSQALHGVSFVTSGNDRVVHSVAGYPW